MNRALLYLGMILAIGVHASESEAPVFSGPQVMPLALSQELLDRLDIHVGDEIWFELEYSVAPEGKVIHMELAEKIWWIQERGLLILGATGLPLPSSVTGRATVFVHVFHDGKEIPNSPFLQMPQKETIVVGPDEQRLQEALASRAGVDANYLSQVANYLAANLTALNVQGSSYSISGYSGVAGETVINGSGEWTGEAVSRTTAWTEETVPAAHLKAKAGGLALEDTTLYGNQAYTHVNLGSGNSRTGQGGFDHGFCTIGGGSENEASAIYATVSGGRQNRATQNGAVVAGGYHNRAEGFYSVIGGGYENTATNSYGTVGMGRFNRTEAPYSWVGGRYMHLNSVSDHTFVWGYADSEQTISAADAFLIFPAGVTGKVGINLPSPTATLDVAGDVRSQVGGTYFHMVPEGAIIMWSGTLATIPTGWQLCDGTNSTPNLQNRFVYGVTTGENPGAMGGQDSIMLNISQMPAHDHTFTTDPAGNHTHQIHGGAVGPPPGNTHPIMDTMNAGTFPNVCSNEPDHLHTGTTDLKGTGSPIDNRPAYYKLAFIMKMP